jgi:hypothetical protein
VKASEVRERKKTNNGAREKLHGLGLRETESERRGGQGFI